MQERIIIAVGKDWDGFTFRLRPKSKQYLKGAGVKTKSFGGGKTNAEPLMDQVSITFDDKKKIEAIGGPIYMYVVEMLTGMTVEEINKIGGVVFTDEADKIIHDTKEGEDAANA